MIRAATAVFSNIISTAIYAVVLALFAKYCVTSLRSTFFPPQVTNAVLHTPIWVMPILLYGIVIAVVLIYGCLLFLHTALRFSRFVRSYRVFTIVGIISSLTVILSNVRHLFEATSVSGIFGALFTVVKDALK